MDPAICSTRMVTVTSCGSIRTPPTAPVGPRGSGLRVCSTVALTSSRRTATAASVTRSTELDGPLICTVAGTTAGSPTTR